MVVSQEMCEKLVSMALSAKEAAYVPYSHFKVGAALLCEDGSIYTGCNIENASYPCTICAERTAISKAVSEGHLKFTAIAVAATSDDLCMPCGMCRQVMAEFAPELPVICADRNGRYEVYPLPKLLFGSFTKEAME